MHISKNDSVSFDDIWKITDDGVWVCTGIGNSYLRTKKVDYKNYVLTLDWRWIKPGNSGILVHASTKTGKGNWPKSVEVQLAHKSAGDLYVYGIKSFKVPGVENRNPWSRYVNLTDDSEKPVGEWTHLEITCRNDEIIVRVNGVFVNHAIECGQQSVAICIQSEKREIHCAK